MPVPRGYALALSAALHTAGLGVAGWASHGQYREPANPVALQAARAYTLTFLTPAPPKPRPIPVPRPSRAMVRATREVYRPAAAEAGSSDASPAEQPQVAAVSQPATSGPGQIASPLRVRELAPGVTVAAIPVMPPQVESALESEAPASRGLYQAAALVTPAGSACPDLPVAHEWDSREVAVAVAFVVDTDGTVDPSRVQVVESPGRQPTGRGFYPRIYVVGTKAGRSPGSVSPADYDALVTHAVTSHILALRFRPAVVGGRPVRSTVLVACHRYPDD